MTPDRWHHRRGMWEQPVGGALLQLYRHKTWATLRLLDYCRQLDEEALSWSMPGTFGTIGDTFWHIVEADEDYFGMLSGAPPSEPLAEGPIPLDELVERTRRLGPRWEALAEDDELQGRDIAADGYRFPAVILMAQAIQHADDHRTHLLSILGARGLDVPRLDLWTFARSHTLLLDPPDTEP